MAEPTPSTMIRSTRLAWLVCMGFGLALMALSLFVFAVFPQEGAGYEPGYGAPVYAFEMAQSVEDLWRVFGGPDDPEHAARIAAMDRGNRWDYLFMVVYGGFIATFFVAAHRQRPSRLWLLGAALGVIAAVADGIENAILLGLTQDLAAAPGLAWLPYPVWTKFGSLIVAAALAGTFVMRSDARLHKALGIGALGATAACLPGVVSPSSFGWMVGGGLGIVWVIQLVYAADQWRRNKKD